MNAPVNQKKSYLSGLFYALLCYLSWGVFPLYWKLLKSVPSEQILAHRIVWSLVFLGLILWWQRDKNVRAYLSNTKTLLVLALTGALVGGNWFVYIYAVNHNHIVDASLGYYINPLVNVLLGTLILREKLNRMQILASLLAFAGVAYLTIQIGRLPVISLYLAVSFGLYGLLRKKLDLQSMPGLMIETIILAPIAIFYLSFTEIQSSASFLHQTPLMDILLILGGPVTALPLFWFGIAATRVPLSTLGFIQYLSPTLQLLIGVVIFKETFSADYFISFSLVWAALVVYMVSVLYTMRKKNLALKTFDN